MKSKWIDYNQAIEMINVRREIIRKNIRKYKFCKSNEKEEVAKKIKILQSGIRSVKRQTHCKIEFSYEDHWKPRKSKKKKGQKLNHEKGIDLVHCEREVVRKNIKNYKKSEHNDKEFILKRIRKAQSAIRDIKENCAATITYSYEDDWSPCKKQKWRSSY